MASTEDIEAKLAAYVDGDLDAAGKAEIEQHLAANESHRKLIAELSVHRDMLRALPRERAPADIAETLQSHLERSVLLGDDSSDAPQIIRISYWPQVRAVAAIVLLVFGLASVVYYVLPRPGATGGELAAIVTQPKMDGLVMAPGPTSGDAAPGGGGTVFIGDGEPDPEMHPPSPAEARSRLALSEELRNGRFTSNAIPPSHDLVASALGGRQAERVIVQIDASNLFAAQTQVRDYLRENNFTITSEEAAVPEPLNLRQSQVLLGARHQQTGVRLKQAPQSATPGQPESTPGTDVAAAAQRELESSAPSTQPAQLADVPEAGYTTQSQAVSFLSSMSRKEIDAMCQRITDPVSGQIAQVIEDPAGLGRGAGLSVLLTPATQPSGAAIDANLKAMDDVNPILHLNPATQPAGEVEPQSISDQRVEVQIVVRGELPESTPDPATQPAETAPTTAPATEPSR